jgi:2-dehydro-3-deoxygalactonokinase
MKDKDISWIAVDCGPSLRATAMGSNGPLAHANHDIPVPLTPVTIAPVLLPLIAPWLIRPGMPVLVCGLNTTTLRPVPCTPVDPAVLIALPCHDPRVSLHAAPGLSQSDPAGIMQGAAVRIAGALALDPRFDGVVLLPGAQSHWAHISAGEVVSFQSFLTGELFTALSQDPSPACLDDVVFDAALSDALSRPEKLAAWLASLRAEAVLTGHRPHTAQSRLLGLLIGAEMAAAKPYWLGQSVVMIGPPGACEPYCRALMQQGISPLQRDYDACTLAGLTRVRGAL